MELDWRGILVPAYQAQLATDSRCSRMSRLRYVDVAFPGTSTQPLTFQLLSGWRCMV
jgi:hypothetical protein